MDGLCGFVYSLKTGPKLASSSLKSSQKKCEQMHRYRYKNSFHQVAVWRLFVKLKTSAFFSDRSQFGLSEGSGTQRLHYCFISQFFGLILRL